MLYAMQSSISRNSVLNPRKHKSKHLQKLYLHVQGVAGGGGGGGGCTLYYAIILVRSYTTHDPAACCRYELMLNCWREQPFQRPTFKMARRQLDQVISTAEEAEEYLLSVSGELFLNQYQ